MQSILENLEWLANYGFIDLIFGIGVVGLLANFLRRLLPANYDQLHIDAVNGGPCSIPGDPKVQHTLAFRLSNAGQTNIFVTRCYFRARSRPWFLLWLIPLRTSTKVHPLSMKITHKDAYELKFMGNTPGFSNYETMIASGNSRGATTFLPLTEPVPQKILD